MSDGPFKSLPMPAHWKAVARRAEAPAYSDGEVAELFELALRKDFRRVPVERVRAILVGTDQGLLFPNHKIEQLEALRCQCEGSAASHSLINCAIEQIYVGRDGNVACDEALKNARDEYGRALIRSAAEHYHRKSDAEQAEYVRDRLDAAHGSAVNDTLKDTTGRGRTGHGKKIGIDEGPEL